MIRIASRSLCAAAALWLSGCASLGITDAPSAADAAADRAIVQAATPAERCLRAAGVLTIVSEIVADRVLDDLADAPLAVAKIEAMQKLAARARGCDPLWFETDLWEVRHYVYDAFAGLVRLRVMAYIAMNGSYDPIEVLSNVTTALRYTLKTSAMRADLERQFADIAAGRLTAERAWDGLDARLARNRARVDRAAQVSDAAGPDPPSRRGAALRRASPPEPS